MIQLKEYLNLVVTFSTTKTQDHKLYIVATGNTRAKKQILAQAGFRWNPERKFW